MALAPLPLRRRADPMIALINIVFLMLVFFLVAASIAPPLDRTLNLAETSQIEGRTPPDALVVHADGRMAYRGQELGIEAYLARKRAEIGEAEALVLRLVPDRALPAADLVALAAELRARGAAEIWIVTERGLP